MKKALLILSPLLGTATAAATPSAPLQYQTGTINILAGKATIQADPTLRYLDATSARHVIVDLWGNPPSAAEDVVGMLIPGTAGPDTQAGWGVVLTESLDGHVSDNDASRINYTNLLHDMQSGEADDNAEREKAGYEAVRLLGWAEQPTYDAAQHKMIWAREIAFGDAKADEHTLNYAVRVLGRDSILELNAVAGMNQLPLVKTGMQNVLQKVSFTPGHRYEDYNASTDKLAAYGLAGLVAGGVAAKKFGLLALLLVLLKKGWVLLLAVPAALSRLFGRSKTA
ncbi:DUF2167 domain-containing protein [Deinococcus maricopensis]|uniref:Membrane-anchored protein n=1 Tax=Deinococcus maricopensis (strain DSM 21211 / LMG 22137 / NRRL B-23946 / LB-34) TaxID=709986 RepID=E8U7W2_DEIML|nr:DUF2167 domain-containing protein [Deinococcus maricopensis]ADV67151.1 Protein of unknown function DUF2167, membrane [Deinococcus maricopensis DSM 21211]